MHTERTGAEWKIRCIREPETASWIKEKSDRLEGREGGNGKPETGSWTEREAEIKWASATGHRAEREQWINTDRGPGRTQCEIIGTRLAYREEGRIKKRGLRS